MTAFAIQRVKATPAALQLIERLTEKHGPLAFFQQGDCSDGAPAICLTKAELLPSHDEVKLGEIGGSPFYVEDEAYEQRDRPVLEIDVATGSAGECPLEGLEEVHFVARSPHEAAVTG